MLFICPSGCGTGDYGQDPDSPACRVLENKREGRFFRGILEEPAFATSWFQSALLRRAGKTGHEGILCRGRYGDWQTGFATMRGCRDPSAGGVFIQAKSVQ